MIVVFDTNVIISALLSPTGIPANLMQRWEAESFDVAISPPLLTELERVLKYEKIQKYIQQPQETISKLITRLKTVGFLVTPKSNLTVIENDPDDNRVLECAIAAEAAFIISGDRHLLYLKAYQGIIILPPAGFLTLLALQAR